MIDAEDVRQSIGNWENHSQRFHEESRSNEQRREALLAKQVVNSGHNGHAAVESLQTYYVR